MEGIAPHLTDALRAVVLYVSSRPSAVIPTRPTAMVQAVIPTRPTAMFQAGPFPGRWQAVLEGLRGLGLKGFRGLRLKGFRGLRV